MAGQMIPPAPGMLEGERPIRRFVHSLLGSDGLIMNPDRQEPDHMFSQGSALYSLVTDFEASRDAKLEARIKNFIEALNRAAVQEKNHFWFPQIATQLAPCSHMAAYTGGTLGRLLAHSEIRGARLGRGSGPSGPLTTRRAGLARPSESHKLKFVFPNSAPAA